MFSGMTYLEFFALNSDGNGMQHGVSWTRSVVMTLVRQVQQCGRACSNTRWFGRKGSVVRGTSVVVHMRVTAGGASVDSPRPQTFLVIDAGLNSVVFAGGQ